MKTLFPLMLLTACGEGPCDTWYCEDGSALPEPENSDDGKGTKEGDMDGDKAGGVATALSGTLDLTSTAGTLVLEQEGCRSEFSLEQLEATDDCSDCDFGFSFTVGAPLDGEMRCDKEDSWTGSVWELGHEAPDQLWFYKDGWYAIDGTSTVDADTWTFGLSY